MNRFALTKYYMDCVTSSGKVILCYASDLTVGSMRLRQSSLLMHSREGRACSRQTFFRGVLPAAADGGWTWRCPALGVRGVWTGEEAPAPAFTLYEPEEGRNVVWQCLAPRAQACLSVGGRREEGCGYMECLTMTLEPWKLPVDFLYWGRFHGDEGGALTWILWEGDHPLSLLLDGGGRILPSPAMRAAPDGARIEFGGGPAGGSLEFSRESVLRTGDVSRTALRYVPQTVKRMLPPSILHLHETKWAGTARLLGPDGDRSGFSIHEVVHFHPAR